MKYIKVTGRVIMGLSTAALLCLWEQSCFNDVVNISPKEPRVNSNSAKRLMEFQSEHIRRLI